MPFSLGELVNMSQHLRDISLGLVELAFPDSRPAIREDYRLAVDSVKKEKMAEAEEDVRVWSHLFRSGDLGQTFVRYYTWCNQKNKSFLCLAQSFIFADSS